ncbi:MAG: hypothetical protein RJA36_3573 [Pseudomonadota bacterium]|jgi:hypothetical protein
MSPEIFGAAIAVLCGTAVVIWLLVALVAIQAVVRRVRA